MDNTQRLDGTVSFTPEMLERLKVAHARAVEVHCDRFIFDGRGYLTDYAKYLIEYLEEQFNG